MNPSGLYKQFVLPPGGLLTIITERKKDLSVKSSDSKVERFGLSVYGGAVLLAAWLALLIGVVIGKNNTSYHDAKFLHWFEVRMLLPFHAFRLGTMLKVSEQLQDHF